MVRKTEAQTFSSVSKSRFYDYSGMVRPTDQEITAIEETVCYSQFPKGGSSHAIGGEGGRRATQGSTKVCQEAEGARTVGNIFIVRSPRKEQVKQAWDRLV